MLLYYVGVSSLIVFFVFRSAGIDYRFVAMGAVAPLILDIPFGRHAFFHTLLFSVLLLAGVMIGTIGKPRLVRRRWLCLPIGTFCALVLSGAWTETAVLWWPTLGWSFPPGDLLPPLWVVLIEEALGLTAIWFLVGVCDLYVPERRAVLFETGRLEAAVADPDE